MRTSSTLRSTALLISLVCLAHVGHAVDPFQKNEDRLRELQERDKQSHPVTAELKGAEIKEYRDKINAVRARVFREGASPAGALLREVAKDAADPSPTAFAARARFSDFSPAVRQQIEAKLQGAPAPDQRVEVQVDAVTDAVTVASVRVVTKETGVTNTSPSSESMSNLGLPVLNVPRSQPAGLEVRPLRAVQETPVNNLKDAATVRDVNAPQQTSQGPRAENPVINLPVSPDVANAKPIPFPGLNAAARVLIGAPAQGSPPQEAPQAEPVALIPLPEGEPLIVINRGSEGKSQIVSVTAPAARLPEALKRQVRTDKGALALPQDGSPVQVTVEVRADRTIRVIDVKSVPAAPAVDAKTPRASQEPAPAVAPTQNNSAPVVPAEGAPLAAGNPAAGPAPVAPGVSSAERFPAVAGAKALAMAIGLDPTTVRLQSPPEPSGARSLSVAAKEDRSIQLDAVKPDAQNKPTAVRAEGRFGDFEPATQQQIREILGRFNAAPLVTENSQVIFEARPAAQNQFQVVSISVRDPKTQGKETVLIWQEGSVAPGDAPPPATDESRPPPGVVPVPENPSPPPAPAPRLPSTRPGGLAPSVAALASKAYGLPAASYSIKPGDPKGGIKIDPAVAGRPDLVVTPQTKAREGMSDFSVVGKEVDFTDEIRAQVDAMLRAAVENGGTWASDALKGNRQILVTFEVDNTAQEPVVRVKEVGPTPQDAARDAAVAMGLRPGDFFVVNVGDQALIVLEKGVTGEVRLGDAEKLKLASPDGDAKVFVNPNKARKDATAVLMLSRESLKANRAALARVAGPGGDVAVKAALDGNPKAGEFVVKVDPNADEKLVIKAMQAGVPDPSLTGIGKKPEGDR